MDDLRITSVSKMAAVIQVPDYPPMSEEGLNGLEALMRKGLVMHQALGIKSSERALPLHIHPETIFTLTQEVRRLRQRYAEVVQALGYELEDLEAGKITHEDVVTYARACDTGDFV